MVQNHIELPPNLRARVLLGVRKEEIKRARVFLLASALVIPASLVGFWFVLQYLLTSFYQTSFYSYLSLIFSDPDVVLAYWQQFLLVLLEALPVASMIVALIVFGALLTALKLFVENSRLGLSKLIITTV
ncbi:hypothetical protein A3I99_00240 [Candidatus Kaiserbacteria bacterium RIFCSPLOWO2_02_FULL_45_11b]|uniref:Uncharacterized protein n=1 Tax=Candidatus Kaiserbacteria bacterium RIFCSPLOWO2_12_FULL_45_26 TaxID=1798525 RepID=A0A1F6FGF4_9BACT|nr:MAG: hypothetical protein A2929_01600 [Candidatus Kaiserbacteria bacterium RIFCSPLOWO2_01_FULL_45_25]OGG84215.1 MAG: hypothetical protein A3I99_00240 [Candidatus Kaiserbacteria bacterium RIFCSPLOWO2_02_FULL_45_11b]OGG84932.1 MAG: hypothetical protein A3G90_02590 [Candidatus Kaiserbacteria bacterium RIFCSPLOWO2_12_FULL_45_26]